MKDKAGYRDALVERILTILRPQLDCQGVVNAAQHRQLQAAIRRYEHELKELEAS